MGTNIVKINLHILYGLVKLYRKIERTMERNMLKLKPEEGAAHIIHHL